MTKTTGKNLFIKDIEQYSDRLLKESPDWIKKIRTQGLARFSLLGIPSVKDEEWKYTNLDPVAKGQFKPADESKLLEKDKLAKYTDPGEINIVFVNGNFSAELSHLGKLEKNLTVLSLSEAVKTEKEVAGLFAKYENTTDDAFVSLNKALMTDGVFIRVAAKAVIKELIHIIHLTSTKEENTVSFPRSLIVLEKSSEATVLESHLGFLPVAYFADPLTDIFINENAKLTYSKAQQESRKAFHVGTTRIWQERNSQLVSFSMMIGARLTRNNLSIILNGEGASSVLNGLYTINEDQHVDNHTSVDHRLPNATSTQLYKGILNGSSRAVFNGKIFVRSIAQKTNSYQLNKNLLLGKDCRVDTKPQLEIYADDVKCTHGATIGQLNEDELFYLETRSIPKKQAVAILSRGFIDEILVTIQNQSIQKKLNKLLAPVFAELK